MKKVLLGTALLVCLTLASCGSGMKVEMDNPTDQPITVTLDGKEYTLAAKELLELKGIKKGEHTMQLTGGTETTVTVDGPSMLNPTLAIYVTDKQEYSDAGGGMDDSDWVDVTIDGREYWGPIEVFENEPVISLEYVQYGVTTDFPEEVETYNESTVRTKLFRAADYPAYYDEAYQ